MQTSDTDEQNSQGEVSPDAFIPGLPPPPLRIPEAEFAVSSGSDAPANAESPVPDSGDIPEEKAETAAESEDRGVDDPAQDAAEGADDAGEGGEWEEGEEDGAAQAEGPALPLTSVVEAVLFAARESLKPAQIARAVGKGTRQDAVRAAIDELNVQYLDSGRAFEIAEISGRFQLMSRPEYNVHIRRIYPKKEVGKDGKAARLTPSALETLSIIAYKQPVTRSEIDRVRGVDCGPALKTLQERGSIREVGRKEVMGRPRLYGTTEAFLAEFGLGSLDELPMRSEFALIMEEAAPPPGEPEAVPEQSS